MPCLGVFSRISSAGLPDIEEKYWKEVSGHHRISLRTVAVLASPYRRSILSSRKLGFDFPRRLAPYNPRPEGRGFTAPLIIESEQRRPSVKLALARTDSRNAGPQLIGRKWLRSKRAIYTCIYTAQFTCDHTASCTCIYLSQHLSSLQKMGGLPPACLG